MLALPLTQLFALPPTSALDRFLTFADTPRQVLTVMSELLERSGRLLVPHCQVAVAGLPNVWNATSSQTPLRCACLQVM